MSRVVTNNFKKVAAAQQRAIARGVRLGVGQILLEIGARADELVPFDTGALSRSQRTSTRNTEGGNIEGEIAYGGPAAPYALVQHENERLSHPPKSKGGSPVAPGQGRGPKYLEFPSREVGKKAEKIIAKSIAATKGIR